MLEKSHTSKPPTMFVQYLRTHFPQFNEQQRPGQWKQQDAEEFYNTLLSSIQSDLPQGSDSFSSFLGVKLEETLSCAESDAEPCVVNTEMVNKIVCNIQNSVTGTAVDHLHEGVKIGLEGSVEKHSPVLGRNALWNKNSKIASLPKYLCFQFMRFFWKATPGGEEAGIKCKILRSVKYPEVSLSFFSSNIINDNYL